MKNWETIYWVLNKIEESAISLSIERQSKSNKIIRTIKNEKLGDYGLCLK
jgi:hypothetical protein